MGPDVSLHLFFDFLGCRECGREAGTRGLKAFGFFFGNLRRTQVLVRNSILLPWKYMKQMVRIEHSEKKNKM